MAYSVARLLDRIVMTLPLNSRVARFCSAVEVAVSLAK
jgi:hypothetical protein